MIFKMGGGCHLAAQLGDADRSARLFELSTVGKLFFYGEDVYLYSCMIHGQYGGIDNLMAQDVEHFGTQLVGYQWYGSLFYQAGADDSFFYFGSLWRNSVFGIHIISIR